MDEESDDLAGSHSSDRCTREEFTARIEFAARLLARRLFPSDVRRVIIDKYHVSKATCDRYVSRARKIIVGWSKKPRAEHNMEALAWWEYRLRTAETASERDDAQREIQKLLGLYAPNKHELSGADGGPLVLGEVIIRDVRSPGRDSTDADTVLDSSS